MMNISACVTSWDNVVGGVEYAARLYGIDKLRVFAPEAFIKELMTCEDIAAAKFKMVREHIDFPAMLKGLYREQWKEYNLSSEILLVEYDKERPHIHKMVQKAVPDMLGAAEAMVYLRRFVRGE